MNVCNRTEADSQIQKMSVKVTQSCPTLCDPMDCSWPGPSVHGILWNITRKYPEYRTGQPFPSPAALSIPGVEPRSLILQADFYHLATREAQEYWSGSSIPSLADLPDPGIEPDSPALQADSLPAELSGMPIENKLVDNSEEREGGEVKQGYGIQRYKLMCIKQVSKKHILYSTENITIIL